MAKTYQTTLLIRGDSKDAVRSLRLTQDELEKLTGVQAKSTTATGRASAAFGKANRSVDKFSRGMQTLGSALVAVGFGAVTRQIIEQSDQMAALRGQLALVTDSQESLNAAYDRSLNLANRTGSSTSATANLYARLARSTEELNVSQDDLFRVTESINKAFVVSGSTAQEAENAIIQLSQGLAAGALRGEEFNSVNEQGPRIMTALADSLGVTRGELRAMAADGEISTEIMIDALLKQSDAIDAEFAQMPMTVGRATNEIRNLVGDMFGSVDTGPVLDAISEAKEIIADKGFRESMTEFAGALISVMSGFAKALSEGTKFARWLGEEFAAMVHGIASDDLIRLRDRLSEVDERLIQLDANMRTAQGMRRHGQEARELTAEKERLEAQIDALTAKQATADIANQSNADTTAVLRGETAALGEEIERAAGKMDVIDEVMADIGLSSQAMAAEVGTSHDSIMASIDEFSGATTALAETTTAETAKVETAWDKALTNVAERIDATFADAWKGAFDSFSDFADRMKTAFGNMLAELAHQAITRPIVVQLGAAMGFGGAAGTASAAGTAASGLSMADAILSGASTIGGGLLSGITGVGSLFGSAGTAAASQFGAGLVGVGDSALGLFGIGGTSAGTAALAGAGVNLGAGLLGGIGGTALGESLFGKTANSSIGATLGGIGGSFLGGPIGAAIGGAIGGALDAAFGSSNSDKWAGFTVDGAGNIVNFDPSDKPASQNLGEAAAQEVANLAKLIGGSSAVLEIGGGRTSGLALNGTIFGDDIDGFMRAAFDALIEGADDLSQRVKRMALDFDGTTEQALQFTQAWASMDAALQTDAVKQARDDFAALSDATSSTFMDSYRVQASAVMDLAASYDGTAQSATELAVAFQQSQQGAYDMAIAILALNDQITAAAAASAQDIRDSVLSEDDLYATLRERRNALQQDLATMLDPEQIAETSNEILALNKRMFDLLGEEGQAASAEAFANFAETTGAIASRQYEKALDEVESTQEQVAQRVNDILVSAGQTQQQAANTFAGGVQSFVDAVNTLVEQGIPVDVALTQAGEVNR